MIVKAYEAVEAASPYVFTDFGEVAAKDATHYSADPQDLHAYERYVSQAVTPSYMRGDTRLRAKFLGFADWKAIRS